MRPCVLWLVAQCNRANGGRWVWELGVLLLETHIWENPISTLAPCQRSQMSFGINAGLFVLYRN